MRKVRRYAYEKYARDAEDDTEKKEEKEKKKRWQGGNFLTPHTRKLFDRCFVSRRDMLVPYCGFFWLQVLKRLAAPIGGGCRDVGVR